MCCDGTLFDNVQLKPGDEAKKLKALGLPVTVSRGKTPITFFRQPCAALGADCRCRVYADRPTQCRSFECRVFKGAQAGRIEFSAARRMVKGARRQAEEIRRLLRELGDNDEHRSLSERFRRVQQRMETGGAEAAAGEVFAELSQAMHRFKLLAHEKFYIRVGEE